MAPTTRPVTPPPDRDRRRLCSTVVAVPAVDAGTRLAAWELFHAAYAGAQRDRFERDLDGKQRVILLHDADDGTLRGFSTVHVARCPAPAGTVVYSGDTVIDPAYWGTKVLQRAFAVLLLRERLAHPARPLYWLLVSKGYKTYLLLAHAFPRAVPRRDGPEDGDLRRVLDAVAVERFGDAYDPTAGVIHHARPLEFVRAGWCPIDAAVAADPDVAFFLQRNPGHAEGDELACLAHVRLRDLLRRYARSVLHAWRRRPAPAPPAPDRAWRAR